VHDGAFFTPPERPIGIQLYGADPSGMEEAARLVTEHYEPDFVDINFGCPVKKVVRRNGGSGCLRDLGLVERIIRAVRSATHLPTTVKIRSGWNQALRNPVEIALRCQEAGAALLTLHPRTRAQMYSGAAQWDEIAAVVAALEIPVVGNGDVTSGDDAALMLDQTGCAGIMIARGSFGNPWIFRQARERLSGRPQSPIPGAAERFAVALRHAKLHREIKGNDRRAALEFRKHLGWYTKGLAGSGALRAQLHSIESMDQIEQIFHRYLERQAVLL
jgi:nifR3 family TIM-barrel protein